MKRAGEDQRKTLNLQGRERILFVDDDKNPAELARQILEVTPKKAISPSDHLYGEEAFRES